MSPIEERRRFLAAARDYGRYQHTVLCQTGMPYLRGDEIVLDGFKGNRVNFRPWNRQLRQPLLLVTHNWVVDRAPLRGFLHQINNLDTLGFDDRDSRCEL